MNNQNGQTTYTAAIHMSAAEIAIALEPLTKREREALQHLARGLTNKEIAAAQCVTTKAVGRRLHTIYQKLGLDNSGAARILATRYAIINGLDKPARGASNSRN